MKRSALLLLLLATSLGFAQESYFGVYLGAAKLGYVSYSQKQELYQGKLARRVDSKNVINAGMLGQGMSMRMSSTSWSTLQNRPIRMRFLLESGGRTQLTDAVFAGSKILVTSDNSGKKDRKTLIIPSGGEVIDDPILALLADGAARGAKKVAYVLDPMTISLVKTTSVLKGRAKVVVNGRSIDATLIELEDPRSPMKLYVSAKGDLIKAEGPVGIAMIPESKAQALGSNSTGYEPSTDLAISSSIKTDKPIGDPNELKRLVMRVSGQDLSRLPSDSHQTVTKKGASWIVDVHPPDSSSRPSVTISQAAKAQPKWVKPSTHVASGDAEIRALAKRLIGKKARVLEAAQAIRRHVNSIMTPNAGIGVLRNAAEVLKTKEGVCRDYAILTAALMRAANIPTRLTSGLVYMDGMFYYHAWVEVFEGKEWIGLDSTQPYDQINPSHVKLSQGNVEDAFVFTFFDKVKLEVLTVEKK
ncbi:MAG: transglutaminase-like domain-containing protein [Fimbriimonadaceae bacterium]